MKVVRIAALTFLIASPLAAQQIPDEDTKIMALKRAYEPNGNSMVGWGSIDLGNEDLSGNAHPSVEPPIVRGPRAESEPPKPRGPKHKLRASAGNRAGSVRRKAAKHTSPRPEIETVLLTVPLDERQAVVFRREC
jgi:hypothetical protein